MPRPRHPALRMQPRHSGNAAVSAATHRRSACGAQAERLDVGAAYPRLSSRTTIDFDVGVPLTSATESRGTSTLVSG